MKAAYLALAAAAVSAWRKPLSDAKRVKGGPVGHDGERCACVRALFQTEPHGCKVAMRDDALREPSRVGAPEQSPPCAGSRDSRRRCGVGRERMKQILNDNLVVNLCPDNRLVNQPNQ